MSSLIGRYRAFRSGPHFRRFLKFATVSLITTAVSQAILFGLYPHPLDTAMGSNVIATCVATVPAYYLNRRWTWGKRGKSHLWKEVMPFWIIALIGLVLSTLMVGLAAHNADRITSSHEGKIIIVHLANFITYGLIWVGRYSILNKFLFGEGTHSARAAAGEEEELAEEEALRSLAVEAATGSPGVAAALVPTDPTH
ncbi:MAG TPA: GtrA family protein [Acidimicrobiales bacterium]|nr:GtrA family protein [Acidimicrobiales bacterium]